MRRYMVLEIAALRRISGDRRAISAADLLQQVLSFLLQASIEDASIGG
jgi:hypothetical protein